MFGVSESVCVRVVCVCGVFGVFVWVTCGVCEFVWCVRVMCVNVCGLWCMCFCVICVVNFMCWCVLCVCGVFVLCV